MKTRPFLSFPSTFPKLSVCFSYVFRLLFLSFRSAIAFLFGCKGTHAILQPI